MARELALQCRRLRLQNIDPIDERNSRKAAAAADVARMMTFDQCVNAYIAAHREKWRGAKHAQEWVRSVAKYASPIFGKLPVQDVDLPLVMKALEPIWKDIPETASRLRGRVESILDWATVRGFRKGDNPAKWSGFLEKLLPSRRDLQTVKHFDAMKYQEVPALMADVLDDGTRAGPVIDGAMPNDEVILGAVGLRKSCV
jgi:hypothetical protein